MKIKHQFARSPHLPINVLICFFARLKGFLLKLSLFSSFTSTNLKKPELLKISLSYTWRKFELHTKGRRAYYKASEYASSGQIKYFDIPSSTSSNAFTKSSSTYFPTPFSFLLFNDIFFLLRSLTGGRTSVPFSLQNKLHCHFSITLQLSLYSQLRTCQ